MDKQTAAMIADGRTGLGIELGSRRIKAVLIGTERAKLIKPGSGTLKDAWRWQNGRQQEPNI